MKKTIGLIKCELLTSAAFCMYFMHLTDLNIAIRRLSRSTLVTRRKITSSRMTSQLAYLLGHGGSRPLRISSESTVQLISGIRAAGSHFRRKEINKLENLQEWSECRPCLQYYSYDLSCNIFCIRKIYVYMFKLNKWHLPTWCICSLPSMSSSGIWPNMCR